MGNNNIQNLENKLWESAEELRGNMSAEEYMYVILGVITLKYISDIYKKAKELDEKEGIRTSSEDLFNLRGAFLVSEKSSWNYVLKFSGTPLIGEKLDEAFITLEDENDMLKGIFPKTYNDEGIDQIKLGNVVQVFADTDFSNQEGEDIIGRIYEFFLGKFFKDRGQKGGEFYTPTSIVQLMVHVLKPKEGKIYDPACGTGGMFVQSKRYIEENKWNPDNIVPYGQEYSNVTWKLAKLNLLLNNFPLKDANGEDVLGNKSADTFTNDLHKNSKFDFIFANPPFNMKKWGKDQTKDDKRWIYGLPSANNANYAWLQHIISKLNKDGKSAVVLANGSLSSGNKDKEIRKNFVDANKVDGIIELPGKLFYTTQIPASIWFFNNNKKTENILMVSSNAIEGNMISKKLRELTKKDIDKISHFFELHENGEEINVKGEAKTIRKKDLEENDYSFVPGRYIESKEEIIDEEVLKQEIRKTGLELNSLLNEFNSLVPNIKEAINKALKYKEEK